MNAQRWIVLSSALGMALLASGKEWNANETAALRQRAVATFGTIPEKMPGSDKDTPARVELGRKLYFDKRLSANETISCSSCHGLDPSAAGADHDATSAGAFAQRGQRNAPTVLNAGFHIAQFWDGRAATLEEQAKGPILNPVEMAMANADDVLKRISADAEYKERFAKTFPGVANPITYDNVAAAIAAFERTLKTDDHFDDFLRGDDKALTPQERTGLELFMNTGCIACHNGPLVGAQSFQKLGLTARYPNEVDLGRYAVTKDEADKYRFKVPSLRNVALTVPYFHDGKVASLEEAVRTMSTLQLGRQLTLEEAQLISGFLRTLSAKQLNFGAPHP